MTAQDIVDSELTMLRSEVEDLRIQVVQLQNDRAKLIGFVEIFAEECKCSFLAYIEAGRACACGYKKARALLLGLDK